MASFTLDDLTKLLEHISKTQWCYGTMSEVLNYYYTHIEEKVLAADYELSGVGICH